MDRCGISKVGSVLKKDLISKFGGDRIIYLNPARLSENWEEYTVKIVDL